MEADDLEAMKYRDLQKKAKELGVKANLPKAELVKKILEAAAAKSKVATPKAKTPKAATPKAKTPKATTPKTATPKAKTPKTATPKPVTPKAATPKAKTPKATTPKPVTPKAATPKVKTPKATTPKVATPKTKTPRSSVAASSSSLKASDPLRSKVRTPSTISKAKLRTPTVASSAKKHVNVEQRRGGIPRFVSKKVPDFAKLHAQEFDKMESLDVYMSKKKEKKTAAEKAKERLDAAREAVGRHQVAMDRLSRRVTPMTGGKTVRRSPRNAVADAENNPPSAGKFIPSKLAVGPGAKFSFGAARKSAGKPFVFTASSSKVLTTSNADNTAASNFDLKASLSKPLGYKPHTGKLKDWSETQKEKRQAMAKGGSSASAAKRAASATAIKGVRMNKRAELLMKRRNV